MSENKLTRKQEAIVGTLGRSCLTPRRAER